MLKRLTVKNFAIISDLTIDFNDFMTVLTGQTGAGKSLIIDTISLLSGQRADLDMIRYGEDFAYIEGVFTYSNKRVDEILDAYSIKKEEFLTVSRTISKTKNSIKVNGTSTNLTFLKDLMVNVCDIHSQNDTMRLFNPMTYLSFIDKEDDPKLQKLLNDYLLERLTYLDDIKKYNEILNNQNKSKAMLEMNLFNYNELDSLNLKPNEDLILEDEINKLSNFDKIYNNIKDTIHFLENDYFHIENIYESYEALLKIKDYDKLYLDYSEKLSDAYYNLDDILNTLKKNISVMDFDPNYLDELQIRSKLINDTMLKYHKNLNELIELKDKLKLEIDMANNYDAVLSEAYNKLNNQFKSLMEKAKLLTNYRKEVAKNISSAIVKELKDLDLVHTKFEIVFLNNSPKDIFDSEYFTPNGVDKVDFMVSLNLGEPLKSLSKIASGGEMSRIMLAFKSYFSSCSHLSLMVFDEIDTGVSGEVAKEIAKKMSSISKNVQVLAISHLPSVAAMADYQYYIYKEEIEGRTITKFKILSFDERVVEIAKMISGQKVSPFALEASKELLNNK